MNRALINAIAFAFAFALVSCATVANITVVPSNSTLVQAETAFAKSMADRNLNAFASFIDEDAVFLNGGKPLRGKAEILAHWGKHFVKPDAPFTWKPVIAEVSATNGVGYTEGPVELPNGSVIATFYSTWQLKRGGAWKVVFDNGHDICDCKNTP